MPTYTYNKLVRDLIPQIIEAQGKRANTSVLEEFDYMEALRVKYREETQEYFEANNNEEALEELADALEVIRALAVGHGASWDELEQIRAKKTEARGGFQNRVYLIDVVED
ncbi:nucleoside triphosphate pyrophosphohydrolase [Paenibacillus guangzhouensis]|uniref:nucleoside triphosphate pyrophosphohydrolase n=1 Tax=Paenibacillus guangzhouensis TaxID=1473112 RepID=UPI0012675602|nr:nucleoside triphosphate pyrophosphohydrolase [Paenibacillus guangzhouensis]